jgi:hypothetical protein
LTVKPQVPRSTKRFYGHSAALVIAVQASNMVGPAALTRQAWTTLRVQERDRLPNDAITR